MSWGIQKLRPGVLGKKGGWGSRRQMGGVRLSSTARTPQDCTGQGPGEHGGGKEKNPKLNYLFDFLCTPELQERKGEKKEMKMKDKN